MAPCTGGIILLIYCGHVRQFTTVADAVQFVRRETITTTWFRKITADIPPHRGQRRLSGPVSARAQTGHSRGPRAA
jgi:hypothetical protein